jgi:hypothetical protein
MKSIQHVILWGSVIVALIIAVASGFALSSSDFYSKETLNWQAQCIGQDAINLGLILPTLLITAILSFSGFQNAVYLWAGTILYLIYTYAIYCFDVHFNVFFLEYCIILGMCIYLLIFFSYSYKIVYSFRKVHSRTNKIIGFYFLVISALFYFLWLSNILPAIVADTVSKDLEDVGLFTNPVHVLDLSVFLPGFSIVGVLILLKRMIGITLIPVILTFFILMDITIAVLTLVMTIKGVSSDMSVMWIMWCFALLSTILLMLNLKENRKA